MNTIIITILAINLLLQLFFFYNLSNMNAEMEQHQEELEVLNYQYSELQNLLTNRLTSIL